MNNDTLTHELNALFTDIINIVNESTDYSKECVIVPKNSLLKLLDKTCNLSNKYSDGVLKCDECALYKHIEDMRIARATINRIVRHAHDRDSLVTADEAENLDKLFEGLH